MSRLGRRAESLRVRALGRLTSIRDSLRRAAIGRAVHVGLFEHTLLMDAAAVHVSSPRARRKPLLEEYRYPALLV